MNSKLSTKIIVACLVWVFVPLILIGIQFYRVSTDLMNDRLMANNLAHVEHIDSYYLTSVNDNLDYFLNIWTESSQLENVFRDQTAQEMIVDEWTKALLGYPEVQSIYFSSTEGAFFSVPEFSNLSDFYAPERHWFKDAMASEQVIWTSPYEDILTGNSVFTVAKRIEDGTGSIIGVLAIDVTLSEMTELLELTEIGEDGRLMVVDANGNVIVSPDSELLNVNIKDRDWAQNLFEFESGSYKYDINQPLVISYITNKVTGWKVIGIIPESELMDQIAPYRTLFFMVILVVSIWAVIGIGGFVLYLYFKVIKRIKVLQIHMEQAEKGGFSLIEHTASKTYDEIEMLFDGFNRMISGQRDLLFRINESSKNLNRTAEVTLDISKAYTDSAHEQASEMSGFNDGMERMNTFIQQITKEMNDISVHIRFVSTAMSEMGQTTSDVANSAVLTSEAISDVLSSLELLDSEIQRIGIKAVELNSLGSTSVKNVYIGKQSLEHTSKEMDGIQNTFDELLETIQALEKYTEEIGDIVSIIEDLTEQTGMLSLNASIEATRAGEHGKGFAAVASAIGRLSEKSKTSTRDIEKIIRRIQKSVEIVTEQTDRNQTQVKKGVQQTQISLKAINEIEESVLSTATAIEEIVNSTENQSEASKSILKASIRVNDLTMLVSASSEEQLATVEELDTTVQKINVKANLVAEETQNQAENSNELTQVSDAINQMTIEMFNASKEIESVAKELSIEAGTLITSVSGFKLEA